MRRSLVDKTFEDLPHFPSDDVPRHIHDVDCIRCTFDGCGIGSVKHRERSTVRNVSLVDCVLERCNMGGAIVEDVTVEGLKTRLLHQAWACAFKHVTLRGRIGRVMLSAHITPIYYQERTLQETFDRLNAEYYANVDWALDISEAEFEEFDARGIPARLIRRDSRTQAVVKRENLADGRWRTIAPDLGPLLDAFLQWGFPDLLLVAPKRNKKNFAKNMELIHHLRDAGIADPD